VRSDDSSHRCTSPACAGRHNRKPQRATRPHLVEAPSKPCSMSRARGGCHLCTSPTWPGAEQHGNQKKIMWVRCVAVWATIVGVSPVVRPKNACRNPRRPDLVHCNTLLRHTKTIITVVTHTHNNKKKNVVGKWGSARVGAATRHLDYGEPLVRALHGHHRRSLSAARYVNSRVRTQESTAPPPHRKETATAIFLMSVPLVLTLVTSSVCLLTLVRIVSCQ